MKALRLEHGIMADYAVSGKIWSTRYNEFRDFWYRLQDLQHATGCKCEFESRSGLCLAFDEHCLNPALAAEKKKIVGWAKEKNKAAAQMREINTLTEKLKKKLVAQSRQLERLNADLKKYVDSKDGEKVKGTKSYNAWKKKQKELLAKI